MIWPDIWSVAWTHEEDIKTLSKCVYKRNNGHSPLWPLSHAKQWFLKHYCPLQIYALHLSDRSLTQTDGMQNLCMHWPNIYVCSRMRAERPTHQRCNHRNRISIPLHFRCNRETPEERHNRPFWLRCKTIALFNNRRCDKRTIKKSEIIQLDFMRFGAALASRCIARRDRWFIEHNASIITMSASANSAAHFLCLIRQAKTHHFTSLCRGCG